MSEERVTRKRGRPSLTEVAARQAKTHMGDRVPVSGVRDILTVDGKDPNYMYRWVADRSENGQVIYRYRRGGYEFCNSEEDLSIGEDAVYKSTDVGSLYRVPAGDRSPGQYLYLMKIRKELYEEDQKAKQDLILARETQSTKPDGSLDQYGEGILRNQTQKA